jgi:hypothetical protein
MARVAPVFLSYVLSFVYVGIYWNNHRSVFAEFCFTRAGCAAIELEAELGSVRRVRRYGIMDL